MVDQKSDNATRSLWEPSEPGIASPLDALRGRQYVKPTKEAVRAALERLDKPVDFTNRVTDELMRRVVR